MATDDELIHRMTEQEREELMSRRGEQIKAAQDEARQARGRLKADHQSKRPFKGPDVKAREKGVTDAADLKEAARQAGEPGYGKGGKS